MVNVNTGQDILHTQGIQDILMRESYGLHDFSIRTTVLNRSSVFASKVFRNQKQVFHQPLSYKKKLVTLFFHKEDKKTSVKIFLE